MRTRRNAHGGGYLRIAADRRQLPGVIRFRARRRAEHPILAPAPEDAVPHHRRRRCSVSGSSFPSPVAQDGARWRASFLGGWWVTHDKYGLGDILGAEDHAVLVDFRPRQRRIP